jgi:hypothetical protein
VSGGGSVVTPSGGLGDVALDAVYQFSFPYAVDQLLDANVLEIAVPAGRAEVIQLDVLGEDLGRQLDEAVALRVLHIVTSVVQGRTKNLKDMPLREIITEG